MKKISILSVLLFVASLAFCQISIKGKILDENNQPLVAATVLIENTFAGTYSNKNGEFSLKNLKPSKYNLKISFIGYETVSKEINLEKDIELEFKMQKSVILTDEVIVQATRVNEKTPATYSNINKEQISKNNNVQDIPYLLSYSPSVVTSSDAGTGVGYTNLNIRGSDVKRINVTVNGIPINDAESHGVWWVDLPDIASSVDNTQIQRGVGTSTNGAGAFGATINLQTTNLNKEPYATVNSAYGSFNTSKNTINVGTGLLNNKFSVDARLSKIWSDGYIDRAFSDLKSFYIGGTMYGKSSVLKLIIFSGKERTYQAWYGVPKDSLNTNRTYNPYSYNNQTDNYIQDNYQLHYSKEIFKNLNANIALHYTKGKGYYENSEPSQSFSDYKLPDAIFNTDTITTSDFITQKWLNNDFYGFTYSVSYKNSKVNTVIGGGINNYIGKHYGDIIWSKIVTFNDNKYRWYNGTGNKKDYNSFVKINYFATGRLNLYADIQSRIINYEIGGIDDNFKNIAQNHKYNFINPKIGVMYDLAENQQLYTTFGIAQREPDRSNFTDADSGKTPKPEILNDFELGYQYRNTKLFFKSNLFNMIYKDQLTLTGEINNVGSPIMTNVPISYRRGIELETGYQITKKLNWYNNITLSNNKITVLKDYTDNWDTWGQEIDTLHNKTISFSPSIVYNSIIDIEVVKNFNLILNSKYVGKQYIDNTQNESRKLNPYFLNNLMLSYTIKNKLFKELNFQFIINNITNIKYETNAWVYKYYESNVLKTMDGYFPQALRNYMVKLEIKF